MPPLTHSEYLFDSGQPGPLYLYLRHPAFLSLTLGQIETKYYKAETLEGMDFRLSLSLSLSMPRLVPGHNWWSVNVHQMNESS